MATVYLAQDLKHDRRVALKVLRPELAAVIGAERFLNEIKVTANLQHPHILPLHDSGDANGFLFYVMPFVEGDTLRDKLSRERQLAIEDAVEITRSIASALDYAHRQGVIHRDIKPENVLLHDGQALIADFGIALAVSHASSGTRLTETGLSIGTPHYMSPEQAMGDRELDARSDIYSLGAMLYEMLAGEPPYQGSTAQAIVAKVITEKAPPVVTVRDTVPPHVNAAIGKALNKMPADRFATAAAFADALTNPAFTTPAAAPVAAVTTPRPGITRRTLATAGAGVAIGLVAAYLVGRTTAPVEHPSLARFVVPAPEGVTGYSRCCGPTIALSPDGEWLVFVGLGGPGDPLYRRRLGQLESEVIPGTEDGSIPFFSPDGRWLGFHSNGRLRRVPMSGGPPVPIAETSPPDGASWGDNDVIVFFDNDSAYTVAASGGTPAPVPNTGGLGLMHGSMLPGGTAALARTRGGAAEARIVAVDLESGAIDTIGFGTRAIYASGYLVYSGADGTLLAQPFDPDRRRTRGQPVALLDGLRLAGPGMGEFALSTAGGLAYQPGSAGGTSEALAVVEDGRWTPISLSETGNLENPSYSPDGRRIAVRILGAQTWDIWILDRDQGTQFRFTTEGDQNFAPVWTPDGSRIAFSSNRATGARRLYWKPSDGSGTAELLLDSDYATAPGSWFPDGRTLAIQGYPSGDNWDIGFLTVGDSAPQWFLQTEFDEQYPQVSPDGRWLAYASNRSGRSEVYVQAISGEGGRSPISTNGGLAPRWSPDGTALYYVSGGTLIRASIATERGFRVLERATMFDGVNDLDNNAPNYDVHPDGTEFLVIASDGGTAPRQLVWILNWTEIIGGMGAGNR